MSSLARAAAKGAFVEEYNKTSPSSKKKPKDKKKQQSKKKKKRASSTAYIIGGVENGDSAPRTNYRDDPQEEDDTASVMSTSYQIPDHGQHDASFNSLQHVEPYRDHPDRDAKDGTDLDASSKSGGGGRSSSVQPMAYVVGPSSVPKTIGGQGAGSNYTNSSGNKPATITAGARGQTYSSYQQNVNTRAEIEAMRRNSAPPVYANNFHNNNNEYYEEWGMAGFMVSCIADACKKSADYALRTGYDTIYPSDHHHHSNSKMDFEKVTILNSYQSTTGGTGGTTNGGGAVGGGQFSGET